MAIAERENVEKRSGPYDKLLISTIAAVVAVGLAGYFLARALPGSPALRCVGFVVFGTTTFIAGTVWWQVALDAIGHAKSTTIPARIVQSLGAIVGLIVALAACNYALFAWTQNRLFESFAGIVASLVGFTIVGTIETRHLAPATPDQVKRLRAIGRMFVLLAAFIVIDIYVGLSQAQLDRFVLVREIILALEFATAPAVLVGAWFVRQRSSRKSSGP